MLYSLIPNAYYNILDTLEVFKHIWAVEEVLCCVAEDREFDSKDKWQALTMMVNINKLHISWRHIPNPYVLEFWN